MKEKGTVIGVKDGKATVSFTGSTACETCEMGCAARGKQRIIDAENKEGASVGDLVEVSFDENVLVMGSALSYIFPLLMFILGYIVFSFASAAFLPKYSEISGIIGAFLSLGLSYFIISRSFSRGLLQEKKFTPIIVRIISKKNHAKA